VRPDCPAGAGETAAIGPRRCRRAARTKVTGRWAWGARAGPAPVPVWSFIGRSFTADCRAGKGLAGPALGRSASPSSPGGWGARGGARLVRDVSALARCGERCARSREAGGTPRTRPRVQHLNWYGTGAFHASAAGVRHSSYGSSSGRHSVSLHPSFEHAVCRRVRRPWGPARPAVQQVARVVDWLLPAL